MPLVIPAPRNIRREALGAFILGLEQARVREEERKRQEEAADQGGGPLGQGIGSAIGAGVGFAVGGPPGAMVGAGIGGALGGTAGALIDPPGAAVPGGAKGQIGQVLQQGTQQVMQGLQLAEQKKAKTDAEITSLFRAIGVPATAATLKAFLAENPGMSKQQGIDAFVNKATGTKIQSLVAQTKAVDKAKAQAKSEAAQGIEFMQVVDAGGIKAVAEKFDMGIQQRDSLNNLINERLRIGESIDLARLPGKGSPSELNNLLQAYADNRQTIERARRRMSPKPPEITTIEGLQRAGKAGEFGRVYTSETIPGLTRTYSDKGAINEAGVSGTIFSVPGDPDTKRIMGPRAQTSFYSARRPDGKSYRVGQKYVDEEGVAVQFDDDGKTIAWPTSKSTEFSIPEFASDILTKKDKYGTISPKQAIDTAVELKKGLDELEELARVVAKQDAIDGFSSAEGFINSLMKDPQIRNAMENLKKLNNLASEQPISFISQKLRAKYAGDVLAAIKAATKDLVVPKEWAEELAVLKSRLLSMAIPDAGRSDNPFRVRQTIPFEK